MNEHDVVEYVASEASPEHASLPCFVHHHDAGGQCKQPATIEVYGLKFCELHGEEIRIAASMQEHQNAFFFFERFLNPHVPSLDDRIERELKAVRARLEGEMPTDKDHSQTLMNAYPSEAAPEQVREYVSTWEEPDKGPTTLDWSLDTLDTIHKLMRIAHHDGKTDLVEILEYERESLAAQAAYADDR